MLINNIFKILLSLILAVIIVIIHFSLIRFLNYPWNLLNLLIPTIIFLFILSNHYLAWSFALFSAYLLDISSFHFFGFYIISYLLIIFLINSWLRNWFTRHSIYSFLALGFLTVIAQNLIYYILLIISSNQNLLLIIKLDFWLDLVYQALGVVFIVAILFYLTLKFSRKLKPFFLNRKPLS